MRSLAVTLTLTTALTTGLTTGLPAFAQTGAELRAVTLSTAGLALLEAEGPLGPEPLTLSIRRADIDDFLKSFRLSDPAGAVPLLRMTGPEGLADLFDTLPFEAETLRDLPALLDAMIGAPVLIERRGQVVRGALMGTRVMPCLVADQTGCAALTLRDGEGRLRQVALDEATEVAFLDAADREAIGRGLDALRAGSRALMVDVTLDTTEESARSATLAWLQPAALWQTAWRAEESPEGLVLTGWAVVENTTGQDWDAVTLTLATGAVQALQAQLFARLQPARGGPVPVYAPSLARSADAAPMFEAMAMDVAEVDMEDTESFSRYTLDTPVTLAAGEMISLPFLRETLDDARLTLFRGGQGMRYPNLAIEVENPLPLRLPAGIVTLFETGRGHAGDAIIPELAPGARETIDFAQDRAIEVWESSDQITQIQSARLVDGVLVAENRLEQITRYRISANTDRARSLTIAHPLRPDWEMLSEGGTEMLEETRFTVDLAPGDVTEFTIRESQITESRIALRDLSARDLAFWSDRVPDESLRALVTALQELRAEQSRLTSEITRLQALSTERISEQERLVRLIVQLGDDSAANNERRARVDALDAEISAAQDDLRDTRARMSEIDQDIAALLRAG